MIVIADESAVYLLAFADRYQKNIAQLQRSLQCTLEDGHTQPMAMLERELHDYYAGKLNTFQTPLKPCGTSFQQSVWHALQTIPYGQTRSYAQIARALGKPTAFRAVAQANGANPLCIIIPCHRVINADGKLGGYAGGIERKQALLAQEGDGDKTPNV